MTMMAVVAASALWWVSIALSSTLEQHTHTQTHAHTHTRIEWPLRKLKNSNKMRYKKLSPVELIRTKVF